MIIVLKPEATEREIDHILDRLRELGLKSHISKGQERTIIGVIGDDRILQNQPLIAFPGVESVTPILAPWKLVSREFKKDNTVSDVVASLTNLPASFPVVLTASSVTFAVPSFCATCTNTPFASDLRIAWRTTMSPSSSVPVRAISTAGTPRRARRPRH